MMSNQNRTHAVARADELLKYFSVDTPDDIQIEDMAYSRGLIIFEDELASADAWLVRNPLCKKGIVRVSKNIEYGRKRFAIAHELGHWELHENISQFDLFCGNDFLSYRNSDIENEANIFASEILMPEKLFLPRCDVEKPTIAYIVELSKLFKTSLTATAVKFAELSYENCMVVFSKDKKIVWFRSSRDFYLRVNPGSSINENTYAYDCCPSNPTSGGMQQVDSSSWSSEEPSGNFVFEDSVYFPNYGIVLSLIWIPYKE